MPIRLLLEHDHLFEPEEIDSLILAFENTLRVLGLTNREDPLTVAVAKLIIQLAKDDERDPGRLRESVLRALGRRHSQAQHSPARRPRARPHNRAPGYHRPPRVPQDKPVAHARRLIPPAPVRRSPLLILSWSASWLLKVASGEENQGTVQVFWRGEPGNSASRHICGIPARRRWNPERRFGAGRYSCARVRPPAPYPRQGTLVTSRMEVRSALGPAITRAGGIKPKEDA